MHHYSVRYHFSQRFNAPASDAFEWATDYGPGDLALMGEGGRRSVKALSDDVVILTDLFHVRGKGRVTKEKLVRIYGERLFWTSTHLTGPNRHSQFLYQIAQEGNDMSRLDFTGSQVFHDEKEPPAQMIRSMARTLTKEDSLAWRRLARAMEKDFSARHTRRT